MRYSAKHKEETRGKILDAAARGFRARGYDGLGIDGLAKAAGVTNGAFYGNFNSKADAYREVVVAGLEELREGIEGFRERSGAQWLVEFANFYFSREKIGCTENTCALPSFAAETSRAPIDTRMAFEAKLLRVKHALQRGLSGKDTDSRAWCILAMLAGGVTLARALPSADLSQHVASILNEAVKSAAELS